MCNILLQFYFGSKTKTYLLNKFVNLNEDKNNMQLHLLCLLTRSTIMSFLEFSKLWVVQ